jgi:hypothetical protein
MNSKQWTHSELKTAGSYPRWSSSDRLPALGETCAHSSQGSRRRAIFPTTVGMGDGRSFGQALRALDKFIVEQSRRDATQVPDPNSPARRAYERIVAGTAQ